MYKAITDQEGSTGTIYLYGQIGQEPWQERKQGEALTDIAVMKAIKQLERAGCTRCNVRINSPGGRMKDGDAIMNLLRVSKMEVHTYVDGIAASMAADIWMVAKKENRHIATNGKVMIHGPIGIVMGNIQQIQKELDRMEKYEQSAILQMAADTGLTKEEIKATYFDGDDHWLTSEDTVEAGLVVKADSYESEAMPTNPEKMDHNDLMKFYADKKMSENSLFKRFKAFLSTSKEEEKPFLESENEEEDMTYENILKAVDSKEIDKAELLKQLGAQEIPAAPATPPAAPAADPVKTADAAAPALDVEAMIKSAVEKITAPMQETITAQAAEIKRLGDAPAATPSGVASKTDVPGGVEYSDAEKEVLKAVQAQNKAMEEGDTIRIK